MSLEVRILGLFIIFLVKHKSPKKQKSEDSPEKELKVRRLRAYDDAIAMLRSIRAFPEPNNIKLRPPSQDSPEIKSKPNVRKTELSSSISSPKRDNRDLQPIVEDESKVNQGQSSNKKYDVVIDTP